MKVAAYCRVSTEEQGNKNTIDNQIFEIKKYCSANNYEIVSFYNDNGVSGSIPFIERPQGKRLLSDLEKKIFECIIFYKLDRIARDTLETLTFLKLLEKQQIVPKSVRENIDNKLLITILAGFSEEERNNISIRSKIGVDRKLREGKWCGGPIGLGFKKDIDDKIILSTEIIPNYDYSEVDIIKLIYNHSAFKIMSCVKIADYLNQKKVPLYTQIRKLKNINNKAYYWIGERVRNILKDPKYKGEFIFGKKSKFEDRKNIVIKIPSIVDEATWNKAQDTLKIHFKEATRNKKYDYLLAGGKIKCGSCGRSYSGCMDNGIKKYMCQNDRWKNNKYPFKCNSPRIRADDIEPRVISELSLFSISSVNFSKIIFTFRAISFFLLLFDIKLFIFKISDWQKSVFNLISSSCFFKSSLLIKSSL